MTILETRELKKIYGKGDAAVHALDGISLTVEKGEFVAVVGTSGSGKSTLLHMMGGLDVPSSGNVTVDGQPLEKMTADELTIFRRRNIGFVFQAYNLVSRTGNPLRFSLMTEPVRRTRCLARFRCHTASAILMLILPG